MSLSRTEKARLAVLDTAADELDRLAASSDLIRVEPVRQVDVKGWPAAQTPEGWPAELYRVTYLCTGFIGLESNQEPVRGNYHQMALYLTKEYPALEPKLAWITPIWHPNIEHAGARHVCTDAPETHRALRPLSELLLFVGEMVQYKRYHARHEPPWPLDREAAKWVVEVAEPRGWVAPDQPVDERPLVRPIAMRKAPATSEAETTQPRRIVFGRSKADLETEVAAPAEVAQPTRIRFGVKPETLRNTN